jgi:hypothetical protein
MWNENWFDSFSSLAQAKVPADDYLDSPASLTWVGSHTELGYSAAVYGPKDANCCPSAGQVVADLIVKDGRIALHDGFIFLPTH